MANALLIVIACGLAWGVWQATRPRYVFVVRIAGDRAVPQRGKVTARFLATVSDVCLRSGVVRGWIAGVRRGQRIALAFSRQIPEGCRQQLRNEWLISGW